MSQDALRPHRLRATILFADITGFTRLVRRLDAEPAHALVTACMSQLDEILRGHGAAIDKYLGDALMAVFGYPMSVEDDAPRSLRAAFEMRDAVLGRARELGVEDLLGLRVGINTGWIIAGDIRGPVIREFHVLGDAVNTAARIKGKTPTGEVYLGPDTAEACRQEFELRPLSSMKMKGKAQAVPVFQALRPRRRVTLDAARTELLQGREAEQARLDAWVDDLGRGRGGIAWIEGDQGLGKSALAAALFHHERLADVPRTTLAAEDGPPLPGTASRGLVVLEDVDRADTATRRRLAQWLADLDASLGVVLTGSPRARRELERLRVAAGGRGEPEVLSLRPLDPCEAGRLLDALTHTPLDPEVRTRIIERAGGSPLRLRMGLHLRAALQSEREREAGGDERRTETERRRATVLFADITGFTAMSEKMDPAEAYPVVAGCLTLLDEIARRHGGTVDKYLGDCVLAMFGVPRAIEDAPRAAVNAAIEMVRATRIYSEERALQHPLDVHIGIETGRGLSGEIAGALIREFAMMGEPVEAASRLTDAAEAGQIFVGAETRRLTAAGFDYRPLPPLARTDGEKGIAGFELLSRRQRLHRARLGVDRRIFSRLVGREGERAKLGGILEDLQRGRGRIVTLLGDAGLGKSRLLAELGRVPEAREIAWREGRSLATGQQLSFHPFADLCRTWAGIEDEDDEETVRARLEAGLDPLLGDDAAEILPVLASLVGAPLRPEERRRLDRIGGDVLARLVYAGVRELLRRGSARRPLAVVLDDLHWADQSSIELLERLLPLAARHPILFLLVARPGFPETSGRVVERARGDFAERLEEIHLRPLDAAETRSLIKNLFRDGDVPVQTRRLIESKAQGNPFYVEEVVRSLVDQGAVTFQDDRFVATERIGEVEIPDTVHGVVMTRVDRLAIQRKQVLEAAAVIGDPFHFDVLQEVLGEEIPVLEELEALEDAEFLQPSDRLQGVEYGFKHPLVREVAYEGLVAVRREDLHRRVGEAVERCLPSELPGRDAMLAYHFSHGRSLEKAERYLFRAGDEAARAAAPSEALHFFRQATQLYLELHAGGGDPVKRATLERNVALALFNKGQLIESVEHFDRALELLGCPRSTSPLASNLRFATDLLRVGVHLYLPGLRGRRPPVDRRQGEIIEIMFRRALSQTTAAPMRFVFDTMATLRRLARIDPTSVPDAGGMYAGAIGIFSYGGLSFSLGRRLLEEARRIVENGGTRDLYLYYRIMNFVHHFLEGDWAESHHLTRAEIEDGVSEGRLWDVTTYLNLEGVQRLHQGDFEGARRRMQELAGIAERYQHDLAAAAAQAMDGYAHLEHRRLGPALEAMERYYDDHPEPLWQLSALATRARIELLRGRRDAAEAALRRAESILSEAGRVIPYQGSSYALARYHADVAALEGARQGDGTDPGAARLARSRRRAAHAAAKVALRRTELLRLHGRELWLRGRRRAALQRWTQGAAEAGRLGARPEGARILAEAAFRLERETLAGRDRTACAEGARSALLDLGLKEEAEQVGRAAP